MTSIGAFEAKTRFGEIARTHSLTSYDAAYLELAMRRSLPLVTKDRGLRAAATALGVALA